MEGELGHVGDNEGPGKVLKPEDFRRAVREGVRKINIFTDLDKAGKKGAEEAISNGGSALSGIMAYEIDAMKAVVKEKISLFRGGY